jgi:hypothetical protein
MKKSGSKKPEVRSQNGNAAPAAARGEDWVDFNLKESAPNCVAIGGARFSGVYRRAQSAAGGFRATRGEWKVFLEPTGWFEEVLTTPDSPPYQGGEPEGRGGMTGGENGSATNA